MINLIKESEAINLDEDSIDEEAIQNNIVFNLVNETELVDFSVNQSTFLENQTELHLVTNEDASSSNYI